VKKSCTKLLACRPNLWWIRFVANALIPVLLVPGTACITVDASVSRHQEQSQPFSTQQEYAVEGFTWSKGSILVEVRPENRCVDITTTTTTTTRHRLKGGHILGSWIGLAAVTALVFILQPQPVSERTPINPAVCESAQYRDLPICKSYWQAKADYESSKKTLNIYRGVMVGVDALSLYATFKAVAKANEKPEKIDTAQTKETHCAPTCEVVGKVAYLRVILDGTAWCLVLGTIGPDNKVAVPEDFRSRQARSLPPKARAELLSKPLDAVFLRGEVVVPDCKDRHDCNFWVPRK